MKRLITIFFLTFLWSNASLSEILKFDCNYYSSWKEPNLKTNLRIIDTEKKVFKIILEGIDNKKENYDSLMSAKKYRSVGDNTYNALALIPELSNRLTSDWAVCPDHVVFLGHEAKILNKNIFPDEIGDSQENSPVFIFSLDQGVYESLDVSIGQKAQLECYFEIIKRQDAKQKLSSLSPRQVSDLLNWDAEKYRQSLKL